MTFVVAEIGVNWDGDFQILNKMIQDAKIAGCNAVKFQSFSSKMIEKHPLKERLVKSSVTNENISKIDKIAKDVGIEWFSTPMFKEAVDFLEPFVRRYKIREFDGRTLIENTSSKLIEKIFETGKEIFVSTNTSPENSKEYSNSKIKWMYCVPKYPCQLSDLDFRELNKFDGYSNHCTSIIAPLTAAILGSDIIEIHTTHNKSQDFIDNNVSFDAKELNQLVSQIRQAEEIEK